MRRTALIVALAAMTVAGGCTARNLTTPERYRNGLVVCLSGAGGMMGEVYRLKRGLDNGGIDRAIESFEWSGGSVFGDQANVVENRRKAARLAQRVRSYQTQYPGRPVHLVGVSAGTGLVVWALENLGDTHKATGAVLIASSLGNRYNLADALQGVEDKVHSFYSPIDEVLSLGVTWAGTVDRQSNVSGGLVGFSPPDGAGPHVERIYDTKLKQISWSPGDVFLLHRGDHLGATNEPFVRKKIVPTILYGDPEGSPPQESDTDTAPPKGGEVRAVATDPDIMVFLK